MLGTSAEHCESGSHCGGYSTRLAKSSGVPTWASRSRGTSRGDPECSESLLLWFLNRSQRRSEFEHFAILPTATSSYRAPDRDVLVSSGVGLSNGPGNILQ